jgi:predicted Rossmann fold flavoprotein
VANRSRAVRDALRDLAIARGVEFRGGVEVTALSRHDRGWHIAVHGGDAMQVERVIVATGGLSVPQTGSDGFGLRMAARLGHSVHPTYPALTPLTTDPPAFADLAGVALPVTIRARSTLERREARGGFLFTHRGYSGPALLDVSHVAVRARLAREPRAELRVSWGDLDDGRWADQLAPSPRQVATALREVLPDRLAARLLAEAAVTPTTQLAQLTREARRRLLEQLTAMPLPWTSDEGYKKAEVMGGGVALDEVHPASLESRRAPGLFLAGELLDAFGPIGGYNFTWAWATGRLAGVGAAT